MKTQRLAIRETHTGYWVVQRGSVQLASGLTRHAAEAERDLLERLHGRTSRRRRQPGGRRRLHA
jgi:hypothetical protein